MHQGISSRFIWFPWLFRNLCCMHSLGWNCHIEERAWFTRLVPRMSPRCYNAISCATPHLPISPDWAMMRFHLITHPWDNFILQNLFHIQENHRMMKFRDPNTPTQGEITHPVDVQPSWVRMTNILKRQSIGSL